MRELGFNDFFKATINAISEDLPHYLLWIALLTVIGTGFDLFGGELIAMASIANLIATLFGQSSVVRRYLNRHGLAPKAALSAPRIGSIFILGLVSGLAIAVGTIALIIPGIFLAACWWVAVPAMFAENKTAIEALQSSWDHSVGYRLALIQMIILLMIPVVIAIGVMWSEIDAEILSPSVSIGVNLLVSVTIVSGWMVANGCYHLIVGGSEHYTNIFE